MEDTNVGVLEKEKSLRVVVDGLSSAVSRLESRVYGERTQGGAKPESVPPSNSLLRESMKQLEKLEKRIRQVIEELPL